MIQTVDDLEIEFSNFSGSKMNPIYREEEVRASISMRDYERVTPPFENLRSLLATAIVLSFYGNRRVVVNMMNRLCKTTRRFITKNRLEGFLIKSLARREPSVIVNVFDKVCCVGTKF